MSGIETQLNIFRINIYIDSSFWSTIPNKKNIVEIFIICKLSGEIVHL
jgi:hypothetical protein